jgi:hypothetical protein
MLQDGGKRLNERLIPIAETSLCCVTLQDG